MEKKVILSVFALGIIALLGVSMVAAQGGFGESFGKGFGMGFGSELTNEDREAMQTQHEKIKEAIENNDFASWKSLHEAHISQMQSELTKENFEYAVARHEEREAFRIAMQEARESGDFTEVESLREQYGMPARGQGMHGQGNANFGGKSQGQMRGMGSNECLQE